MSISQAVLFSSIAFVLPVELALISGGAISLAELIVCTLLSMAIVGSLQTFTEFGESLAVILEVHPRIQMRNYQNLCIQSIQTMPIYR